MTKDEAINWIINISADIGKAEHRDLWHYEQALSEIREMLETAQPERKTMEWIPVKTRPMTQEEREYYELHWDADLDDDEAVLFNCPMPHDKQTIWVTTKNGYLFQDTCENDDGYIGLEGNGDWYDIVAWMPVLVPEPYKEKKE